MIKIVSFYLIFLKVGAIFALPTVYHGINVEQLFGHLFTFALNKLISRTVVGTSLKQ